MGIAPLFPDSCTRERIPSEEKDDPCVFLDFFVFWRLCEMYLPDVQYFFVYQQWCTFQMFSFFHTVLLLGLQVGCIFFK